MPTSDRRQPAPLFPLPSDITLCVLISTCLIIASVVPQLKNTPFNAIVGTAFLLLVPGYGLVSTLFPKSQPRPSDVDAAEYDLKHVLTVTDRLVLSVASSAAIFINIGLIVAHTPLPISLDTILTSAIVVSAPLLLLGAHRRRLIEPKYRFSIDIRKEFTRLSDLFTVGPRRDLVLNVAVILAVVGLGATMVYATAVPSPSERYTEFYLVTEDESGNATAGDYPAEFVVNESEPVTVGIRNQEYERMDYSVVVLLQEVSPSRADSSEVPPFDSPPTVVRQTELERYQVTLSHNETVDRTLSISPSVTGDQLRLTFLLYRGQGPADSQTADAYRQTHTWISVGNKTG